MTEFSWSRAWTERLAASNHRARLRRAAVSPEEFWDGFGALEGYERYTAYPGEALNRILEYVGRESTVLDIGAGSGAFAIPLARAARSVTVVEPSSGQLSRLRRRAEREGVQNIRALQARWEEVDAAEVGSHDVVLAAYSLQMEDIRGALAKMHGLAVNALFLLHFAGHDLLEPIRHILGRYDAGPDYIYLCNVLREMELRPDVEVLTRDYELPLDLQLSMFAYSQGLSEEHLGRLREYLESNGRLVSRDGTIWVKRRYSDALVSIRKDEEV